MRRSRLLYTATVKPTMLYGAPIWGVRLNGEPTAKITIRPIEEVQNSCLRRITGGYKRSPRAALERETAIPPIDIQIDQLAL